MNILVTGGAGFIGGHTVVELLATGHAPIVVDNYCNSTQKVQDSIFSITNKRVPFYNCDVRDTSNLVSLIKKHSIDGVIHFAALKAVGESVANPLLYYQNNIGGLLSVLEAMDKTDVDKLIFSSSATVYGDPDSLPITEDMPFKPATNPYGSTKQIAEKIIEDVTASTNLRAIALRYFNPIGAHPSGLIGELPLGAPNNLVPYVVQAAAGIRASLTVYGSDYDTIDGTGVRDYIHVVDLAKAHVCALQQLQSDTQKYNAINLGTGSGTSVLQIINTFERVNGVKVPYHIGSRRDGDIASCYASAKKAHKTLGWTATLTIEDALRDAWRWQQTITPTENR